VADAISRRPDCRDESAIDRTIQAENGLVLNKDIRLNMINIESEDKDLRERIEEKTNSQYPEIDKDEDGDKRFNAIIIVPKEMETDNHPDIRMDTLVKREQSRKSNETITSLVQ
jgi:hypothetical protein